MPRGVEIFGIASQPPWIWWIGKYVDYFCLYKIHSLKPNSYTEFCLESVWSLFGVFFWSLLGVCWTFSKNLLRFSYDIADNLLIDMESMKFYWVISPKIKSHVSKIATYVNKNSNAMKLWSIFIPLYTHCTIWMLLK